MKKISAILIKMAMLFTLNGCSGYICSQFKLRSRIPPITTNVLTELLRKKLKTQDLP